MRHATDFGDAQLEAGLVSGEVVTDLLAVPGAQEVTRMFAGTAVAEVVDLGLKCGERRGACRPRRKRGGFLLAGGQHLYRRFIGVNHALGQHCFAQRIDQWLKLYAGLPHPVRQCRARDSKAGTAEDLFLSIDEQKSTQGQPIYPGLLRIAPFSFNELAAKHFMRILKIVSFATFILSNLSGCFAASNHDQDITQTPIMAHLYESSDYVGPWGVEILSETCRKAPLEMLASTSFNTANEYLNSQAP